MKLEGDEYVLATGRRIYANGGILGIAPDLDVFEGYDGTVESAGYRQAIEQGIFSVADGDRAPLTVEERIEIAEFMARLWQQWGQGLRAPDSR